MIPVSRRTRSTANSIQEILPPWGFRIRIALAAHNQLSAIRRLAAFGRVASDDTQLLAEAQTFSAVALSLIERVQSDQVFWKVERHLRGEEL